MSKKRKEICILTFARAWNTLVATRDLGVHGVEVITGDSLPLAASSFSKYSKEFFLYPDPDREPEKFINRLVEVCQQYSDPDTDLVLMPMHTDSFLIAKYKERFQGIAKFALPDKKQIDQIGNKASLAKFAQKNNIYIPRTKVIEKVEDFEDIAQAFTSYPAFLKISDSNAAIGLHRVVNAEDAIKKFKEDLENFQIEGRDVAILQEAVKGEDYCSTFLFNRGKKIASMTYHNILDFPRNNGMGALRETIDGKEMEKIGEDLLAKVGWHGVVEIDFRWDGKSTPYLIEVNPRFWGGLGQAVESGLNYPYLLFRLAVDGKIDRVKYDLKRVKTYNPCLIGLIVLQEFLNAKNPVQEIKQAFSRFEEEYRKEKDFFKALEEFSNNMFEAINPLKRIQAAEQVIEQNKGAVNEILKREDALPLLGVLYPLAVLIRHGKITPEMLVTGAGKSGKGKTEK